MECLRLFTKRPEKTKQIHKFIYESGGRNMLYTSVNTDYNNDIQNWDEIEHQIKCLAETVFTHTSWMHNW